MLSEGSVPVPFTPSVKHAAREVLLQPQMSSHFPPHTACLVALHKQRKLVCLAFEPKNGRHRCNHADLSVNWYVTGRHSLGQTERHASLLKRVSGSSVYSHTIAMQCDSQTVHVNALLMFHKNAAPGCRC